MRGVVLAGGLGTRLDPLTRVTNKHLLPVYDRPMIHYPLGLLTDAGLREVLVVTGGNHPEAFRELLGDGSALGLTHLEFAYQPGHGGIADALRYAEAFADGGPVAVVLGDNVFQDRVGPWIADFAGSPRGAMIFLKQMDDPRRFGVAEIRDGRVVGIEEKPRQPRSPYAVTGLYLFDAGVFDVLRGLRPSARGELEITDVNNAYAQRGALRHVVLPGWWSDAGTFDSLLQAATLVAEARRAGRR